MAKALRHQVGVTVYWARQYEEGWITVPFAANDPCFVEQLAVSCCHEEIDWKQMTEETRHRWLTPGTTECEETQNRSEARVQIHPC